MPYRDYPPADPLLFGYDPVRDLPPDHLARLVERVVEQTVQPKHRPVGPGQPAYDPRLCVKVLTYGYATGVRSSRALERLCSESLPYLFLTRGEAPSHTSLCTARLQQGEALEAVWVGLFAIAEALGIKRLGHLVIDSSKLRADASSEAVLKAEEYQALREELERIKREAEQVDAREDQEGSRLQTRLGQTIEGEQMRDILRRVRKQQAQHKAARAEQQKNPTDPGTPAGGGDPAPSQTSEQEGVSAVTDPSSEPPQAAEQIPLRLSLRMRKRIDLALAAIKEATEEGRKHLCLTDPDARMMGEGREKRVRECYCLEVAMDNGLMIVGQTCQEGNDNARLDVIVQAAKKHEPEGVVAVDADSGYYSADRLASLIEEGIDTCVPDSYTACDMRRGLPIGTTRANQWARVPMTYDPTADVYVCPEGNVLRPTQTRVQHGQQVTVYRAQQDCSDCPRAPDCLSQEGAQRRTLKVAEHSEVLEAARQRFADPEHQQRYHHRAEAVETVFGFIRSVLCYHRFVLRGMERVGHEARLLKLAYSLRKVHKAWASA